MYCLSQFISFLVMMNLKLLANAASAEKHSGPTYIFSLDLSLQNILAHFSTSSASSKLEALALLFPQLISFVYVKPGCPSLGKKYLIMFSRISKLAPSPMLFCIPVIRISGIGGRAICSSISLASAIGDLHRVVSTIVIMLRSLDALLFGGVYALN